MSASSSGGADGTPQCANCGAEIPWPPAIHRGKAYCCGGCAQGGPCYCSYDLTTLDWLYPAPRRQEARPGAVATTGPRRGDHDTGWS